MAKPTLGHVLRPLVAILLTGYVLWLANPAEVFRAGTQADLRWIAAAIALVAFDRALMAYRWIVLLCPIEPAARPPLGELLRVFFISTFVGTFLPASVGGDIVRAYQLWRLQVARGAAVASVLMDRLLGVVSIVLVGAVGLVVAGAGDLASTRAVVLSMVVASAGCIVGLAVVFSETVADLARRAALALPIARVRELASELAQATRAYSRHHAELVNVLAGSVAVQILRIVQAYCLGRAIGLSAPFAAYLAFVPMILLVMLLPISVYGIGTSQAAFVWFFARVGTPAPEAFALSVLFLALGVVGNLPGGLLYAVGPSARSARS